MDTAVELAFGDGEYRFWLPLPQVFELQRKTGDTSILVLEHRLRGAIGLTEDKTPVFAGGGEALVADALQTIRLALIGGNHGMVDGEQVQVGPVRAKEMVDTYCYPSRPFGEAVVLAWRILHAAIHGIELKKKTDDSVEP